MGKESEVGKRLSFELKYCERCGGLWLRPAGGGQIYCAGCARQIAEMPPVSRELDASSADCEEGDAETDELREFLGEEMFGDLAGGEA